MLLERVTPALKDMRLNPLCGENSGALRKVASSLGSGLSTVRYRIKFVWYFNLRILNLSGFAAGHRTDSQQILQQRRWLFQIGLALVEKTPLKSIDIWDTTNVLGPKHFATDLDADLDADLAPKLALFVSDLKMPTKNKFLCLLHHSSKIKSKKNSHKTVEIIDFSSLFCFLICIRSWIPTNKLQIRMLIQKARKNTDPTDPELWGIQYFP